MFWLHYWLEMFNCLMEKRSLAGIRCQQIISDLLDFGVCALHRFNGKFTLNLSKAQVFETKKSLNKLLIHDYRYHLLYTNRYIHFILQADPGFLMS